MKVDFHFHLEEGPYSFGWLERTARALEVVPGETNPESERNTLDWLKHKVKRLENRLAEGCFTERWLEAYFIEGQKKGIQKFGIVDHLYRFKEFRGYYEKYIVMDDSRLGKLQRHWFDGVQMCSIEDYLQVVRSMQDKGFPVAVGVEADYFPGGEEELKGLLEQYELDYVIGSVHFIDGWGFDNPEVQDIFETKNLVELYRYLFEHVKGAANSGLFDIIAHLDNLKVFNYRPEEQELLEMYDDVAATLKKANVASEINTGLAYRYPVKEMCPSPTFLSKLYEHGVPITLSSDSHYPDDIGTLLDEAATLAKQTGYKEIVYFEKRQRMYSALEDRG
ncbi:histidinol-phosphatase (PHP family) [Paenibacillus sp. DS2015]|uniref:histidinol-phosphatase HisJ family protein n=1 Tax=Paenibacillus sp. DS2015 TaxID=3373917 RepID=UPI003D20603E